MFSAALQAADIIILSCLAYQFIHIAHHAQKTAPLWWTGSLIVQAIFNFGSIIFSFWRIGALGADWVMVWATLGHLSWLVILIGLRRKYEATG